ncbi:radical SAM protein [Patescibacteria group bacterium]|nr:radical SAM protein [Patescibacteria group bacterium]
MKKIELSQNKSFLINPENGKWGISSTKKIGELEEKLRDPLPKKEYLGTRLIVINSSNKCNLDCVYCSEKEHRMNSEEMTYEIAKKIVDRSIEDQYNPEIVFHGSEPTRNFDFIKKVIFYGYEKSRELNKRIRFSIQSNLAEIPEDFLDFIKEYSVGVSTSIDGTREIHDKLRPYKGQVSSFEDIFSNAKRILNQQGTLNVVTVITKFNVKMLNEISDFFESEGITSWQTIPVEKSHFYAPEPQILGESYTQFFDKIFSKIEEKKQRLEIKSLAQYLSSIFFHNGIDSCRICSSSNFHPLIAIDQEGDAYPCDYFWGDKKFKIGNVTNQSLKEIVDNPSNLRMRDINETNCSVCTWKMICGGGCLAGSYESNNEKPPYCLTHKIVYDYLSKKMPELIGKDLINPVLSWLIK